MNPTLAPATQAPTKDYRAPLRFWHWGNTFLVTAQLTTILFQKVIVNSRSAVPEFQQALSKDNVAITMQQGRAFAHIISERIWAWHVNIGLVLAGFWVLRIALGLIGPSNMRFSARLLEVARRYRLAPPAEKGAAGKILFAKSTYALFYIFLAIMSVTGLIMVYEDDVAIFHTLSHTAEEVHNVTMYLIISFFVVHVVGVVWSEMTKDHGLISRMVGGEKVA